MPSPKNAKTKCATLKCQIHISAQGVLLVFATSVQHVVLGARNSLFEELLFFHLGAAEVVLYILFVEPEKSPGSESGAGPLKQAFFNVEITFFFGAEIFSTAW